MARGWPTVLAAFLRLGLTSFGGPIAHIGYFREAFVARRQWLDDRQFAALLALCQLLPGPASSQLGMAIGHARAGWAGALAAWIGFTLPSAVLMASFAWGLRWLPPDAGWLHGLKLAAVAVVAQAVLLMARQFASDAPRVMIALAAGAACLFVAGATVQVGVIAGGGVLGVILIRNVATANVENAMPAFGRRRGLLLLVACVATVGASQILSHLVASDALRQTAAYLRAGALVFGGGHVVLPLLREGVVATGAAGQDAFLAAYGAAQALPGPLFAIAAFPGWLGTPGGAIGAALATVAIFLPGGLLLFGMLPFWSRLIGLPRMAGALAGANAAVVGLLGAALWDPLWRTSVRGLGDILIVAMAFAALWLGRLPVIAVVAGCALAGWLTVIDATPVAPL